MNARQKAQEIVDAFLDDKDLPTTTVHKAGWELLIEAIEQALLKAAQYSKRYCPCGGTILADTDECKVPVCIECCIEISKAYLNMDENYNEGFKRGMEAAKVEIPTFEEARKEMSSRPESHILMFGASYREGFMHGCSWFNKRMSKEG